MPLNGENDDHRSTSGLPPYHPEPHCNTWLKNWHFRRYLGGLLDDLDFHHLSSPLRLSSPLWHVLPLPFVPLWPSSPPLPFPSSLVPHPTNDAGRFRRQEPKWVWVNIEPPKKVAVVITYAHRIIYANIYSTHHMLTLALQLTLTLALTSTLRLTY